MELVVGGENDAETETNLHFPLKTGVGFVPPSSRRGALSSPQADSSQFGAFFAHGAEPVVVFSPPDAAHDGQTSSKDRSVVL